MDATTGTIAPDTTVAIEIAEGTSVSFDCQTIPANARLDLLKRAVEGIFTNRINQAVQRHSKDEKVKAWVAYENAVKADPLQSAVAKPDFDKPAGPDLAATFARAVEDLQKGELRQRAPKGEGKGRERVDPLVQAVTNVVVNELYEARKSADPKVNFLKVKSEVGKDGVAYLKAAIEAKVAAGADRAALEKYLEDRYLKPARAMLGIDTTKKLGELPSIL